MNSLKNQTIEELVLTHEDPLSDHFSRQVMSHPDKSRRAEQVSQEQPQDRIIEEQGQQAQELNEFDQLIDKHAGCVEACGPDFCRQKTKQP